jgi:hypothetical protein
MLICGEEEADNSSIESPAACTDQTGLTGTIDGDTSIFSESTTVNTSLFTGFTDYSEVTGVTSNTSFTGYTGATIKTSFTGYTGATSRTSATGYTTGSGDTSESSDTVRSYSDDKSFLSISTKSHMTKDTSLFDLDMDDSSISIKPRPRKSKRGKKPKRKNFFVEVMSDLLSIAEEIVDERDGCRRGLSCMGYRG